MVPPFVRVEPTKSYIRIPGSGKVMGLGPKCIDLSRMSNIPPQEDIPSVLKDVTLSIVSSQIPATVNINVKLQQQLTDSSGNKPSNTELKREDTTGCTSQKRKFDDVDEKDCKDEAHLHPCAKALKLEETMKMVKRVIEDKEKLQKENSALKQKIWVFQQLMRNRDQLERVLNRIEATSHQ